MTYRSDIDGLRAVAVLSVMLYHFKFGYVSGGFVGVDVFFVISGFLITAIIAREIENEKFSFLAFYERRIRRIFPALFVLLLATSAWGLLFLYPSELKELSGSIVATLSFVSNFYFYSLSGYFQPDVELKPLLHTWSLAVEEQYYLVFPIFLLLAYRHYRRFVVLIIAAIAFVSFVASAWLARQHPAEGFYFSPPRFWEMLVGSFLALSPLPHLNNRWLREIIAAIGLGLILSAIFILKPGMPFPGVYALPPVLGAAAVIYAGQHGPTLTFRFLSLRPIVLVGLMSYSLYLWHWPVAAYGHLWVDRPLEISDSFVLIPLTAILAFLSWRYVEKPFRHAGSLRRSRLWIANIGLSSAGIAVGILIATGNGLPSRFSPEVAAIASNLEFNDREAYRRGICFLEGQSQKPTDYPSDPCLTKDPSKPTYLLIGDSHGAHLWPGLNAVLPNINVLQATSSGCKPVENGEGWRNCVSFMNSIFARLHEVDPQLVILSARWEPKNLSNLVATVDKLKGAGRNVVVLGPINEYRMALARLLADSLQTGHPELVAARQVPSVLETDKLISARMSELGVPYISVYDLMCPGNGTCQTFTSDHTPMQWDYGHLTKSGSIELAAKIASRLPSYPVVTKVSMP